MSKVEIEEKPIRYAVTLQHLQDRLADGWKLYAVDTGEQAGENPPPGGFKYYIWYAED